MARAGRLQSLDGHRYEHQDIVTAHLQRRDYTGIYPRRGQSARQDYGKSAEILPQLTMFWQLWVAFGILAGFVCNLIFVSRQKWFLGRIRLTHCCSTKSATTLGALCSEELSHLPYLSSSCAGSARSLQDGSSRKADSRKPGLRSSASERLS